MKFTDAQRKLKKIVGDTYRSLSYEKTFNPSGDVKTECFIYVGKLKGFYKGHDWEEAFAELEKAMKPKPIEETP